MSAIAWVAFVAAGAVGAPLRYFVDTIIQERNEGAFPWGTLVVNASGSLLLGFVTGLALYHAFPEDDAVTEALLNALGTLVTCAAAAALGLALAAL